MEPNKKIAIQLDETDALKFKEFLANYETFSILLSSGVFSQRSSAVTLHFDGIGTLRTVQRADVLYARKSK